MIGRIRKAPRFNTARPLAYSYENQRSCQLSTKSPRRLTHKSRPQSYTACIISQHTYLIGKIVQCCGARRVPDEGLHLRKLAKKPHNHGCANDDDTYIRMQTNSSQTRVTQELHNSSSVHLNKENTSPVSALFTAQTTTHAPLESAVKCSRMKTSIINDPGASSILRPMYCRGGGAPPHRASRHWTDHNTSRTHVLVRIGQFCSHSSTRPHIEGRTDAPLKQSLMRSKQNPAERRRVGM